jgi:cobyrinic acid a,c-diamide synthase
VLTDGKTPGFLISAPSSGSGKTVTTLALLRAYRNHGRAIGSFKVGPDYIDPAFHTAASGRVCFNLDLWGMRTRTVESNLNTVVPDVDLVIGEGVMGLFDGASGGGGSTADIAVALDMPVILVVDASGQATSAAALVHGFDTFDSRLKLAGVIFNRIGGPKHRDILQSAMASRGTKVFGFIPRHESLTLPERHLGLVQALENSALEGFLDSAAEFVAEHVDLEAMEKLGSISVTEPKTNHPPLRPLGQKMAVARDQAFAFAYPHVLDGWQNQGAELTLFSPLADETPQACDAIYLPGGYPELHAGKLASNANFLNSIRSCARENLTIFGECGGYMVLGQGLVDADNERHEMAGLLPLETSFADRRLHLGYREVSLKNDHALGAKGSLFRAHEFHYATITREEGDEALFIGNDSEGNSLGTFGHRIGAVAGSFIHLIDQSD